MTRREFMARGMWGTALFCASISGLSAALGVPAPAFAAETAGGTVAPAALALNPNWWKQVLAQMAAIFEVPILDHWVATGKDAGDAEIFRRIDMFGNAIKWGTRVIPIKEAIHHSVKILPYQEFEELLMRSESIGVSECWCRTTFKNCDNPTNTCIHLAFPGNRLNLMEAAHVTKMGREEIRKVIDRAEKAGLVHELVVAGDDNSYYVVCNCCECCCAGLRGLVEFGYKHVARSEFVPQIDAANCTGCGACLKRCRFKARSVSDGKAAFDPEKCMGCGLCSTGCPQKASFLVKRV